MAQGNTGEGFAYSMVDLMTSLVVIFILLLVYFLDLAHQRAEAEQRRIEEEKRRTETQKQQTESNRELVITRLQKELVAVNPSIQVKPDERDPLTLLIIVPEELLRFEENQASLREVGKDFLNRFTPTLTAVLCAPDLQGKVDSLIIEGHTNSRGEEWRNIPLSTERATKVTLYSLDFLRNKKLPGLECFLTLASANGRGPRDPILDSDGKEDLEKSKRVEFKVRVRSLEQRQLQELQEQLHAERPANS
ncbi:MAG: OmpA family protein [Candidatus Caldarchaeum sp.]